MGMERLTVPIEWKASTDDSGTLEGYLAVFDNVDLGRDVIVKGAFAKTIAKVKSDGIPLLADHVASVASVLGTIYDAREDTHGLYIKAKFSSAPSAQDVRIKLIEGHLGSMSVGYEATKFEFGQRDGKTVRFLQEMKLWEGSVVVLPMNPEAIVSRVKSLAGVLDDAARASLAADLASKATSNETRDQLNELVREAYGADKVDVWIRDFDESKVWFTEMSADEAGIFEQTYETDSGGGLSLIGERVKVRPVTSYVPDSKSVAVRDNPAEAGTQAGDEPDEGAPDEGAQRQAVDETAGGATDEGAHWDRWASEALLAGNDPDAVADPADVAGLRTLLELNEAALGLGSNDTETE